MTIHNRSNLEAELIEAQRVANIGSWQWDAVSDQIWWSDQLYHIYEKDPNSPPADYETDQKNYSPESAARLTEVVQHALKTGEPYVVDLQRQTANGEPKWVQARGEVVRNDANEIVGLRGTVQDITEKKLLDVELNDIRRLLEQLVQERTAEIIAQRDEIAMQRDEIARLANTDDLTGLPVMRLARDRLQHACDYATRKHSKVALLFIDVDGFKTVNDTFGHAKGDFVLREIANRLVENIRQSDMVVRLGGDEFIVILEDIASVEPAHQVAKKILHAMTLPVIENDFSATVSVSIGIALFPDHADSVDCLVLQADMAMYSVKNRGKNNIAVFSKDS